MNNSVNNIGGQNYRTTSSGKIVRRSRRIKIEIRDEITISSKQPMQDDSSKLAKMANKAAAKQKAPVKTDTPPPIKAKTPDVQKVEAKRVEPKEAKAEKNDSKKGFWSRFFKVGTGATVATGTTVAGASIGASIGIASGITQGAAIGTAIAGPVGGLLGIAVGMSVGLASGLFTGGLIGAGVGSLFGTAIAVS